MKRALLLPILLVFFGLITTTYAPAQTETTSVMNYPYMHAVYIPCMDETLYLTGTLHILTHTTLDGNGGFHARVHFQPAELKGITSISEYEYVGVGVTQETFNGKVGEEYTFINNFYMIGKGKAPNYKVQELYHYTVRPDGTIAIVHDDFRATCK